MPDGLRKVWFPWERKKKNEGGLCLMDWEKSDFRGKEKKRMKI